MRFIAALLAALLTACGSTQVVDIPAECEPITVIEERPVIPPRELLQTYPLPAVAPGISNGELLDFAMACAVIVRKHETDKAAIRR